MWPHGMGMEEKLYSVLPVHIFAIIFFKDSKTVGNF